MHQKSLAKVIRRVLKRCLVLGFKGKGFSEEFSGGGGWVLRRGLQALKRDEAGPDNNPKNGQSCANNNSTTMSYVHIYLYIYICML